MCFSIDRIFSYGGLGPASFALLPINSSKYPEEKGAQVVSIEGHGPNKDRQDRSHCHEVQFHNDYLYGVDLGTDTINVYRYDQTTGELQLNGDRIKTEAGAGPRHLLFHPDKPLAFVCNELNSTTNVYRIDAAKGKFEHLQVIATRRSEDQNSSLNTSPFVFTHPSFSNRFHQRKQAR